MDKKRKTEMVCRINYIYIIYKLVRKMYKNYSNIDDDSRINIFRPTIESFQNIPERPKEKGCYVYAPNKCQKQPKYLKKPIWSRDVSGEKNKNAGNSAVACNNRQGDFRKWCGNDDILTHYVGPAPPKPTEEQGCYVYAPNGCSEHPSAYKGNKWLRDTWGEKNNNAYNNKEACDKRQQAHRNWCKNDDILSHYVGPKVEPKEEEEVEEPKEEEVEMDVVWCVIL